MPMRGPAAQAGRPRPDKPSWRMHRAVPAGSARKQRFGRRAAAAKRRRACAGEHSPRPLGGFAIERSRSFAMRHLPAPIPAWRTIGGLDHQLPHGRAGTPGLTMFRTNPDSLLPTAPTAPSDTPDIVHGPDRADLLRPEILADL